GGIRRDLVTGVQTCALPIFEAALNAIGDPTSTLIIPIPIQYATSTAVTVQGVKGVAVGDNTGLGSGVIWIKGNVFAVAGPLKQEIGRASCRGSVEVQGAAIA